MKGKYVGSIVGFFILSVSFSYAQFGTVTTTTIKTPYGNVPFTQ